MQKHKIISFKDMLVDVVFVHVMLFINRCQSNKQTARVCVCARMSCLSNSTAPDM